MTSARNSDTSASSQPQQRGKRKRRLLRSSLAFIALLVILAALAPTILSLGFGRASILGAVGARLGLPLTAEGWSLSWFGSQEVRGLSVRLPDGPTVATVGRASLDQGLLSLIRDSRHIGPVRVEQGELWTDRLAKAIDIIQKMPSARPPRPEQPPALPSAVELKSIMVHAGPDTVHVQDARFLTRPDGDLLTASAELDSGGARGTAVAEATLTGLSSNWRGWNAVAARGTVRCKDLPLAAIAAAAADLGVPMEGGGVIGRLDGDFSGSADGPLALKADLEGRGLWVTGKALSGDRPELDSIALYIDGTLDGRTLSVRTLKLASPVATADLAGTFSPAVLAGGAAAGSGKGSLRVELAPLARMLPKTLGTYQDVIVTSGTARASFDATWNRQRAALAITADLKDVRGTRSGKPISLEPVTLKADVEEDFAAEAAARAAAPPAAPASAALAATASAPPIASAADPLAAEATATASLKAGAEPSGAMDLLKRLRVKAAELTGPFGSITAEGRLEDFRFDAALDLARASAQVGQFIDLRGSSATGSAVAHLETKGNLDNEVRFSLTSSFKNLKFDLGKAGSWSEQQAGLSLNGNLTFTSEQELAGASLEKMTIVSSTGTVEAAGSVSHEGDAWTWSAQVTGDGEIAPAARLHRLIMDLQTAGQPAVDHAAAARGSKPAEQGLSDKLLDLVRRAAGVGGTAGQGRWHLDAAADGNSDKFIHVLERVTLADVLIPAAPQKDAGTAMAGTGVHLTDAPPVPAAQESPGATGGLSASASGAVPGGAATATGAAKPLRIADAVFASDSRYDYGPRPSLTITNLNLKIPGLTADVGGHTGLPADGGAFAFRGKADVTASADLAALARTLEPLGIVPPEPAASGQVDLKLSASAEDSAAMLIKLAVDAKNVDIAWRDGRRVKEAGVKVEADPTVAFDAHRDIKQIDIKQWTIKAAAGSLAGTAALTPAKDAWSYSVTGSGEGAVEPLAATIAGLMGKPPSAIRGNWKIARGTFVLAADGSMTVDAAASASDLVIPQSATGTAPARPDVRLADARLAVAAAMDKAGSIKVRTADIVGPGIAAKASGSMRLATDADKTFAADGAVTVKADLDQLAEMLRPFGLLPADMKVAGAADFDGKVASGADGVSGSGTLDVADLDVQLPADQLSIQEKKLHVPLTLDYKPGEKRWDAAAAGMTSSLVAGTIRGAYVEGEAAGGTPADARITAQCGISIDAGRVQQIVAKWLPANLQVSGAWRVSARAAGPLHLGVQPAPPASPGAPPRRLTWNEQIADLVGDGIVEVGRLQYEKIVAGNGTVRLKLADGRIDLNPTPAEPSRLAVAGGTVNLAGVIELGGPVPRLIIAGPMRLIDGVPLSDPGLREYLKFGSPVIGASINPEGKVTVDIASLVLPLAEAEYKKMVGAGSFAVDRFQTELSGPLGTLSQWVLGIQKATPMQALGPVKVRVAGGEVIVEPHTLALGGGASMELRGKIGLDEKMDVEVQIPLTQAMLNRFGVSAQVAPYLLNQKISVPLTGTIAKPELDDKVVAKRIGEMVLEAAKRAVEKKAIELIPDLFKGLKR